LSFYNLGLRLKDIDTKDLNKSDAYFRFSTSFDDNGFINLHSNINRLSPFVVDGDFTLQGQIFYTLWRYIKEDLNIELADGNIALNTNYHFNLDDLNTSVLSDMNFTLSRLRVKPKNIDKDILKVGVLNIDDIDIKPFSQKVDIKKVHLDGLDVKVKKDKDNKIDWRYYTKVKTDTKTDDVNKSDSAKWDVLVELLALEGINIEFLDKYIRPNVKNNIKNLNIYAKNITLDNQEALNYDINMHINNKAKCNIKGLVKDGFGSVVVDSHCKDIDIVHNLSYIEDATKDMFVENDIKLKQANLNFDANIALKNIDKDIGFVLNDSNLSIIGVRVDKKSTKEHILKFKSFKVSGVDINDAKKSVDVKNISLNTVAVLPTRYKNNKLNIDELIKLKDTPKQNSKTKKSDAKSKDYRVKVKKFKLQNSKLLFKDEALEKTVVSKIDRINFELRDIDSKKYSWAKYKISSRINNKGKIYSSGTLRHTPLKQKGNFSVSNISLKELTPYLQESSYVEISDGKISLKGKINYFPTNNDADLIVKSSFRLSSLFVNDSRDESLLLSLNDVDIKSFTYELNPDRFYVEEMGIDSFYVNAKIDKNKVLNFSKLQKNTKKVKIQDNNKTKQTKSDNKEKMAVSIAKISFSNGSSEFSDYSIPIKFRTHIHNLSGDIYALSNRVGETSYVSINGDVDKYGLTRLIGSIDGSNPKKYMDLTLSFKNLNLSAMSGYSSSFAGYAIDDGKLFLDLHYKIVDSKLESSNNLMIKKIKLGKEIEDENITKLPLGFVIGLLEDSDGIIDIDMPIEGDVDNPDFKYSKVVWNVFSNLITKAVSAPFKFLASAMGIDGDDLEYIEFEPSKYVILPTEREKLDNIAKIMTKKPKVLLSFGGSYDTSSDKLALQKEMLIDEIVKLSDEENVKKNKNSLSVELLEDLYENMRDDDKVKKLKKKLKKENDEKSFKQKYRQELIKLCLSIQTVTKEQYEKLALARRDSIFNYLVISKGIDKKRFILEDIKAIDENEKMVKNEMEIQIK
jgi:hypothetical protein